MRIPPAPFLLILATLSALAVVPDWPHRHVDDPSYWGVVGFVGLAAAAVRRVDAPWVEGSANRNLVRWFLIALPLIYVANWFRWGGSVAELALQTGGLLTWVGLSLLARRSDLALWGGCALHALWDAAHFGRAGFIPEWYVAGCLAADLGFAAFVALELARDPSAGR